MTATGRDIEQLLHEVQASLEVYEEAGVGTLVKTNVQTSEESLKVVKQAVAEAQEKRAQLDQIETKIDQYLHNLQASQRAFASQRKQRFQTSSEELHELLDDPLQPQLVLERERLMLLKDKLKKSQQTAEIAPEIVARARQVKCMQSFALSYDKVKDMSTEQVWQVIADLWE